MESASQTQTSEIDALKAKLRATWIAGDFGQIAKFLADEAEDFINRLGVQPGSNVLDVACGTGNLALPAARLGAKVVATDWSPTMIARLEARAREEGLNDVSGRVMDCHALELDDHTFDVTGSQFGVMLVPDQPLALREMARVTRRGGRVLLIAYGAPNEIEFLHFFIGAIQAIDPDFAGPSDSSPPLEFQVSDPAVLRARLEDAGLTRVTVDTVTEKLEFRSGEELWNWILFGNPIASVLTAHLTSEQKIDVSQTLDGMLRERSVDGGPAILTNPVHIGIGVK